MRWPDVDRAFLIAEQRVQRLTGQNGEWRPDAESDDADPNEYSGLRYVPKGPFTNWAEKAKADAQDAWKKEAGENPNMNGLYWTVEVIDER